MTKRAKAFKSSQSRKSAMAALAFGRVGERDRDGNIVMWHFWRGRDSERKK